MHVLSKWIVSVSSDMKMVPSTSGMFLSLKCASFTLSKLPNTLWVNMKVMNLRPEMQKKKFGHHSRKLETTAHTQMIHDLLWLR